MRLKIIHPLWTHLPAIAALVLLIAYLIATAPLPSDVALHFSFSGQPDSFGSPWSVSFLFPASNYLRLHLTQPRPCGLPRREPFGGLGVVDG